MGKIIAIGGGDIRIRETLSIDQEIIKLTGKKTPKILFIPTASNDNPEYIDSFTSLYSDKLSCITSTLLLIQHPPTTREIESAILTSDAIYVGGGNTFRMMRIWRRLGVDKLLKKAFTKGIVLSGLSAGANCWFAYSHSDSRRYTNPDNWKWIRVTGLGLLPFMLCPHYHEEQREESFAAMMGRHKGVGIALDRNTAIEINDNTFRILTSQSHAKAYMLWRKNGKIRVEKLPTDIYQKLPIENNS